MELTTFIQVRIKEDTEVGSFSDCICFTPDEYDCLSKEDIENIAIERISAHIDNIKNAPAPDEPTKEELEAYKASLQASIDEVDKKLKEA